MYDEERNEMRDQFHRLGAYSMRAADPPAVGSRSVEEAHPIIQEPAKAQRYAYTILRGHDLGLPYAVAEGIAGCVVYPSIIASFTRAQDAVLFVTAKLDDDATPAPF